MSNFVENYVGVFFSDASPKKDTIFGAAQTKLGSSYFVRALENAM